MKRLAAGVICVVTMFALSACANPFYHDDTITQAEPAEIHTQLLVRMPDITNYDPELFAGENSLPAKILAFNATRPEDAPRITAARFTGATTTDATFYTLQITVTNAPAQTLTTTVRPFRRTYTRTIYNPLELIPDTYNHIFVYYFALTDNYRYFSSTATLTQQDEDGTYYYYWSSGDPNARVVQYSIQYPNRPLYYLIVLVGAALAGVVTYFVARALTKPQPVITTPNH